MLQASISLLKSEGQDGHAQGGLLLFCYHLFYQESREHIIPIHLFVSAKRIRETNSKISKD